MVEFGPNCGFHHCLVRAARPPAHGTNAALPDRDFAGTIESLASPVRFFDTGMQDNGDSLMDLHGPASDSTIIPFSGARPPETVRFDRKELSAILTVYGRHVAAGEWRDYAIVFGKERAIFAILRRTGEAPLYRIEKDPKRAEKQGAYSVIAQGGRILKRGQDLERVLRILEKPARLVAD